MKDKSKKVIDIFLGRKSENKNDKIRYFSGFNYVRLDRDSNGNYFVDSILDEYAEKQKYIISVKKMKNGHISLYNYEVEACRLLEFIGKFINKELDGEIVEIDKFQPDNLA